MVRKLILIFHVIFLFNTANSQGNRLLDSDGNGILNVKENKIRKIKLKNWVNRTNVQVLANSFSFTRGYSGWNNSVNSKPFSDLGFKNNYIVSFNTMFSAKAIIGFGIIENGNTEMDVDYGFMFDRGKVSIYENGVQVTTAKSYWLLDDFSIVYERNQLKFFKNKSLLKVFDVDSDIKFYLDTSFKGEKWHFGTAAFTYFMIHDSPASHDIDGVFINTVYLPISKFDVISGDISFENLFSGTGESEIFIDFGADKGEDKVVLINVQGTTVNAPLNLRITRTLDTYKIEVLENNAWLLLSPEYFRITNNTISFGNISLEKVNPFQLNLVNGVEYNRLEPLKLSVNELVKASGASMEIKGPNNFSIVISPNVEENNFIWDGTQAQSGVYTFKIQLQGKFFNGQFLIL